MKKTINVQLHKNGTENDFLTRIIANMNGGKGEVSPRDIEGYFSCTNCAYPTTKGETRLIKDLHIEQPNMYHVTEDGGKTITITLEFCEVYELEQSNGKITDPETITLNQ